MPALYRGPTARRQWRRSLIGGPKLADPGRRTKPADRAGLLVQDALRRVSSQADIAPKTI
jgi:hypothetical protein